MSTPFDWRESFSRADVDALTDLERALLVADLDLVAEELARTPGEPCDRAWAALTLRRRIGGPENLRAYARVLVQQARRLYRAGEWQAPAPPVSTYLWNEDDWLRYIARDGHFKVEA